MAGQNFVFAYMEACFSGKLPFGDCGPVWQIGIIALLLVLSVAALFVLRLRSDPQSATG